MYSYCEVFRIVYLMSLHLGPNSGAWTVLGGIPRHVIATMVRFVRKFHLRRTVFAGNSDIIIAKAQIFTEKSVNYF
jgi:hypothetical protein